MGIWLPASHMGRHLHGCENVCVSLVLPGSGLVLTLTTTPIQLTDGIEYILRPLKRIGVPAHEIAMMMTIALRFIPTLLDETDKIIKAQQARGALWTLEPDEIKSMILFCASVHFRVPPGRRTCQWHWKTDVTWG